MYLYSLTHAFLVLCVVQLLLLRENYIHGSSGSVIFYISYNFVIYFFIPLNVSKMYFYQILSSFTLIMLALSSGSLFIQIKTTKRYKNVTAVEWGLQEYLSL